MSSEEHRSGDAVAAREPRHKLAGTLLVSLNLLGTLTYLWQASHGWRARDEVIPIAGEPFVWASALPVVALFLVLDLVWFTALLRARRPGTVRALLLTLSCWAAAIVLDYAHH